MPAATRCARRRRRLELRRSGRRRRLGRDRRRRARAAAGRDPACRDPGRAVVGDWRRAALVRGLGAWMATAFLWRVSLWRPVQAWVALSAWSVGQREERAVGG